MAEKLELQNQIFINESSDSGFSSSSSIDIIEDDASSSSSSSNNGPLYELSDIMAQLPIKRGISKFYRGKSQSYTSLASVKSVEDLAKKLNNHKFRSKMKSCKSFGGLVFEGHRLYSPKATICRKASRGSFLSSLK